MLQKLLHICRENSTSNDEERGGLSGGNVTAGKHVRSSSSGRRSSRNISGSVLVVVVVVVVGVGVGVVVVVVEVVVIVVMVVVVVVLVVVVINVVLCRGRDRHTGGAGPRGGLGQLLAHASHLRRSHQRVSGYRKRTRKGTTTTTTIVPLILPLSTILTISSNSGSGG